MDYNTILLEITVKIKNVINLSKKISFSFFCKLNISHRIIIPAYILYIMYAGWMVYQNQYNLVIENSKKGIKKT